MNNWENKTAILYSRVSTTEQKDNGYSLAQQKSYLSDFCKRRGIKILEYYEEDYTSTTFDRPQYKKILKSIKILKPDFILFHKWDRFSREPDGIAEIERLLSKGIIPNSISEWVNFSDPSYYIYIGIYILQAKVENKKRSDRTKDGILGALKEGRHVNKAPIGYINGKDPNYPSKPLIQPCPDKAPLIASIFKEYATGFYSQKYLRKKYQKLGILRSESQFSNMLSNIKYAGKIIVPEHNGNALKIINALHEPIVDMATFEKVQQVKSGKANIRVNSKKNNKHEEKLPLRGGILKCSKCGSNLTGSPSKSRNGSYHYYYHCNSKKGCKERFSVKLAHNELNNILESLKPSQEVLKLFKEILVDEYKSNQSNRINMVKKLINQKNQIEETLDNLTEKFINDSIDNNSYNRLKGKYNDQISNLTISIDEYSDYQKDIDLYVDFGIQFLARLSDFYKKATTEIKRKIIGSIFSEKLVFENKKYRTAEFNDAFTLIFNKNNKLLNSVNKKKHVISNVSYSVAGTGLEPVTFGL